MFEVRNLNMTIGNFVLQCHDLKFPTSGITAIRGPSGSGKTTFFRILSGEVTANNWSWVLDGVNMSNLEMSERRLGIVFQSYDLFPNLTVEQNVQIVMRARKNATHEANQKLQEYKVRLGLDSCWNTRAESLSGGEQQRTALLRAVMSNPRYLLLDEPFSALNPELRDESRKVVAELIRDSKIGALLITHDERDVQAIADREIKILNGKFLV